jgi:carbamoylphosphate synthase large subunit
VQSPPVADPDYRGWLERILDELEPDLYVPLVDGDIVLAAELAETRGTGTRFAAPPPQSARICWDKLETDRFLHQLGVPSPDTWLPGTVRADGDLDLVVKARYGQGSLGFRALPAGDQGDGDGDVVLQRRCEHPEVTVDAFLARDGGRFRAVCRERLEVKAGVCSKARVFEDAELSSLVEAVVRGLGLHGGACVQLMRLDGGWAVTDVNARTGGGTRMSSAAGVDVIGAVYADLLGLPFDGAAELAPLPGDVYVVRQPDELIVA